jgi:3-phosphoshikimate 1-carboxyvinyltransferase
VALDADGAVAMKPTALEVRPGRIDGTLRAPPSKSETHRAYLLAAQSDLPCRVRSPLRSEDTQATLSCLHDLGARLHLQDDDVQFLPAPWRAPKQALDCRNSGTTLRLLTVAAARVGHDVVLTGDESLRNRPNAPLLEALTALGARVSSDGGKAPITVRGPLRSGVVSLPPRSSSQYASALLLGLALLPGPSTVELQAPVASSPYLDVTLASARAFGLRITEALMPAGGRRFDLPGGDVPRTDRVNVEGDWSAAAFPLVAAAITAGRATVTAVRQDSPQGDRAIVDLLRSFGAKVRHDESGITCEGPATGGLASPGTVDVAATPDLFPALCILAACSRGTTTFTGGSSLRAKESDRIRAMAVGLTQMGITARERPDGLEVDGGLLRGATVASLADHRIHMAFAVAGLAANGTTTIDDPGCAAVSYPGFHPAMTKAGAPFTLLQGNVTTLSTEEA